MPALRSGNWRGVLTGLSPADAHLLDGLRSGDEQAYEALIERFQTPVYSLVYRLMADPSDAGDVVQEVFLKVFRSVGSLRMIQLENLDLPDRGQ